MPFRAMISCETAGGLVTPYAGASFGLYWIYDYGEGENAGPGGTPAAREDHGDGVLTVTVGVELYSRHEDRILIEYTYFKPLLDDPGDNYSFAENHIFQIGMRY
jgi:hypothetical protein